MNRFHRWYCRSARWQKTGEERLVPWVVGDVALGSHVLEVGPGPGLTTAVLARGDAQGAAADALPSPTGRRAATTAGRGAATVC